MPRRKLAARFWPGPLTLVLRRAPGVGDELTGGEDTIGLRIPGIRSLWSLLRQFGEALRRHPPTDSVASARTTAEPRAQ